VAWARPDLLRAHVLPPLLAPLAAAAAAAGNSEVGPLLDRIPALRQHLVPVCTIGHAGTAAWARARIDTMPVRPPYDLHVGLLGAATLHRGATRVTDTTWTKRDRVQQLLAVVVLFGRLSRRRAGEVLWPNLPVDKAMANLRTNLSHLQRVLQPDRRAEQRPWFVVADGEVLVAAAQGILVDVHEFEAHVREAQRLDAAGRTTAAMDELRAACSLYRGDLLAEVADSEWADPDRRRLRTLALGATTRLAELCLARGEPEEASEAAVRALRWEPLHEPAGRCFAKTLAGQGDRAGAMRSILDLIERCRDEGLRCDPETLRLAASLGVESTLLHD
jgi:DNA-binding SARP family transcriptional activator